MSLRNFQRGEKYKPEAQQLNAWNDAARANIAGPDARPGVGAPKQWLTLGQNTGTLTIDRFDAVELVGPSITDDENPSEFDSLIAFDVQFPEDPQAPGQIAIAQETIAPGKLGRVLVFGVTPCREIQVDAEDHTRARFGTTGELVSSTDGPVAILWKSPEEQSSRRAVVSIDQARPPASTRWGRIVSSTQDASIYRWDYSVELVRLDGSLDWQPIPDLDLVAARNTIEASNTDDGLQGNGVDAAKLPDGFDIVAIGDGAVIQLSGPYGASEADPGFYMFSVANLVDGECQDKGG